ncbi:MAG: peptidoglycan D,D-transpeptidase FtsI family protein [Clostridiaceae bacterium]
MQDITTNVKKVMIVFLIVFIALITYITYFQTVEGPALANREDNKRSWAIRNEILRGNILDRNNNILASSKRLENNTQERQYTKGDLFAHSLGYIDPTYGLTGLEKVYDNYLMEDNQFDILQLVKNKFKALPKQGDNLVTTLDSNIQQSAYDALGNTRGSIVVLDVNTGGVISMVSKPSFDPNNLENIWKDISNNESRPLLNRAVSGLYPPGSTFKIITAISGLKNIQGLQNQMYNDTGKLSFGDSYTLNNYAKQSFGNITMKTAMINSVNTYFGNLAINLGNDTLKSTAEDFYFNKDTPADGMIIDNSQFPTYKSYEKGNIAQSGIGQSGILATPMEMALVAQTVANNGTMMKPFLVQKINDASGNLIKTIQPESLGEKVSSTDSQLLRDYMLAVVNEGTGRDAKVSGVKVAGKTGTADHVAGKQPHSWFIGFAPYDNPKYAIAVVVEESGGGNVKASKLAGEVFKDIFKK